MFSLSLRVFPYLVIMMYMFSVITIIIMLVISNWGPGEVFHVTNKTRNLGKAHVRNGSLT